jgi:hypothetical protein
MWTGIDLSKIANTEIGRHLELKSILQCKQ